jgi:exonuclease SbcD
MDIKFAHISDCHLGGWRKDTLNRIGCQAFSQMIEKILEEEIDFVIISGDLYDVSNPKVEIVDFATRELKKLYDKGIPVYGIMGSHDFSPSGKSMLRPLISADFFRNVSIPIWTNDKNHPLRLELFEDKKTKIKLTGMRARKKGLEIDDFQQLDVEYLEKEPGVKIFLLHTILNELKPKEFQNMESGPKSMLPRNFLYYAGGHIHKPIPEILREKPLIIKTDSEMVKKAVYPGCLTPTNFLELENQQYGGFCIVSGDIPNGDLEVKYIKIPIKEVICLSFDANNKSAVQVKDIIDNEISRGVYEDKIVVVRIQGSLVAGKSYDIKASEIVEKLKQKGAYEVLVNKIKLISEAYEKISIDPGETNELIEARLIHEHVQKTDILNISKEKLKQKINQLLSVLGRDIKEGEKVKDYDQEVLDHFNAILDLNKTEKKGGK